MTDGGQIPSEGQPEHLLPETGTDPAQGGGGWGTAPVGQAVPVAAGGAVYHFIDQPDDEDDVLLMPGPQGSWSDAATPAVPLGEAMLPAGGFAAPGYPVAEAGRPAPQVPPAQSAEAAAPVAHAVPAAPVAPPVPVAGQPTGTPVEPSWPPLEPPAAQTAEPVAAPVVVELPGQAQPVAAAQQARRPLHAGPPIPDPSLMTGQVPVRSLADRGPSAPGGTPPHGVPLVAVPGGTPAHGVPGVTAPVPVPAQSAAAEPVAQAVPVTVPAAAPTEPVAVAPVGQGVPVAAAAAPVEQPVPVVPVEVAAVPAQTVAEPVPAVAVAPVEVPAVEAPAAPVPAPVEPQQPVAEAAAEAGPVPAEPVVEAAAAPPVAAEQHAAPAAPHPGHPRRIAAFLADPAPLGLAVMDAPVAEAVPGQGRPLAEQQPVPVEAVPVEQAVRPEAPAGAEQAVAVEQPAAVAPVIAAEPQPVAVGAVAVEQPAAEQQPAAEPVAAEPAPAEAPVTEAPVTETPVAEAPAAVEPTAEPTGPAEPEGPRPPAAPGYDEAMREAVHQVMRERRDIRNGFRPDPVPHEVLLRVLEAAHTAPSVGYSQPWDFVVIRSTETRRKMHELAARQREAYADSLPKGRAKQFKEIKIEAILDTPVNIVVTADRTRGGRHTLGRHTQPQMAPYSAALAVENLWLAARAEGLGVGWVSFFDEEEMVRELGLPEHLEVVAYLCVGYVDAFPDEPELQQQGWAKRRPLSWVVHEEQYGNRALPGEEPHSLLADTLRTIRPLDAKALGEAWDRQKRMTKPAGSLGMLEIISAQLSGLSRKCPPPVPEPACVAIFAGDHGVHAQGVTPWPQEVTAQMVANFLAGGAVVNSFAAQVGAEVCVVDVGVKAELPDAIQQGRTTGLLPRKVKPGTDDMTQGPAMTREEALKAVEVGIETARDLVAAGNKILITGDMGIANTTASAALISVITGADPAEVTGRGTGIDDETHARKVEVIRRALELHRPDPADPIGVLAAVGGLEHAAIAGFLLGAASLRTPVILDGVIAGSAALIAKAIAPEVLAACIAGHRSAEPGHQAALAKLGLRPLIDLDLRLGEGTGALLALPLVQSAARAMHDVATFDSAGVTEKG
ncbi:nicotinate-nucleotide--dimethylbenzimidazole phosphoribosyltransferase [Kitasatospora sp. NPDC058965]|uniref:nicotinate-nucleotide--dimethylbenzimidazole phosphoribosyltransferase n=1 Tax=Kitasatospora sp. NPDC058965 TaxID=3346682 RepID=UPI003688DEEB